MSHPSFQYHTDDMRLSARVNELSANLFVDVSDCGLSIITLYLPAEKAAKLEAAVKAFNRVFNEEQPND